MSNRVFIDTRHTNTNLVIDYLNIFKEKIGLNISTISIYWIYLISNEYEDTGIQDCIICSEVYHGLMTTKQCLF